MKVAIYHGTARICFITKYATMKKRRDSWSSTKSIRIESIFEPCHIRKNHRKPVSELTQRSLFSHISPRLESLLK